MMIIIGYSHAAARAVRVPGDRVVCISLSLISLMAFQLLLNTNMSENNACLACNTR